MTPDRWQQVKGFFDQAVACAPAEREAFLRAACAGDHELYEEIASLVGSFETAGSFFEKPLLASPARADPMIGREFGVYRIVREIGRGGMGSVYLAVRIDDQFRRRVALKAIKPEMADDHALRRFQNERQTLAVLDHPNIIKLLDGGQAEDGLPYLVMDYVEGQPIDEYCASHKLSIRERLELFRTVCAAVHYAHQNLVVHRDLKPGNILVTPEGVPKLLDFGIAKLLRPEYMAQAMGITRTRLQPMTPKYASPEQVLGQPVTTASDIYSLGVLLYELLTGHHPFARQEHSGVELERAIADLEPERPSVAVTHADATTATMLERFREVRPEHLSRLLSGDLDMIVLMAMRKEPQRRYPSAEHLAEDVRRHLAGLPVVARKGTVRYCLGKFVRRHKPAVAAAVVVALALVTSTWIAEKARQRAERRFRDLRQFANFVVRDLDDALRSGATPGRREALRRAVESLDGLAREAKDDPGLQRDLILGYIKMGDVQGNFFVPNLGEKNAAEESYRKALVLAEALWKAQPSDGGSRMPVAAAYLKLGDMLANRKEALEQYRKGLAVYQALPATDREVQTGILNAWSKIATTQEQLGDDGGALQTYRLCMRQAREQKRRTALAIFQERVAYFAAIQGDTAGAEEMVRESIRYYREAEQQRNLAKGYKTLAEVEKRTGNIAGALESVGQSLEITRERLEQDPRDKLNQIDYEQAMVLRIGLLQAAGSQAEARRETVRTLEFVRSLLDRPDTSEYQIHGYVWLLVTTPFAELRNDEAALRYAQKLVAMTHEEDPEALDLLARAQERRGDRRVACETERKALDLLPPAQGRKSELRTTLETNLRAWETHPAGQH